MPLSEAQYRGGGLERVAVMARAAWSAFECSSLASKTKNLQEQERLFLFGYDQGQKFIAALKAGKREHLSTEAPAVMLLLLEGPTPDFMLGRIFEVAQRSALEEVYKTGQNFNSEEIQETIAKDKFWNLNCQLIGK
jgi:hypothetical protein